MKKKIMVVGSSNTDMVIKCEHLPVPGETILGRHFFMNPGGKGANQAVAAARLEGNVSFLAKTGNDIFGEQARKVFGTEGIDTSLVLVDSQDPSGIALINVNDSGENSITVAPGANAKLFPGDVLNAKKEIAEAAILLIQLEIPLETVESAIKVAHTAGCKIILNPAPAQKLSPALLSMVEIITPNETEAELLTGIPVTDISSATKAGAALLSMGVEKVVFTLGAKGAYLYSTELQKIFPAPTVKAVDTTAAGDIFNGALALALSEDLSIEDAIEFAVRAASISVTRLGAQASAPRRKELL